MADAGQFKLRLPQDVKAFLSDEAKRFGSSISSEVIRAVRERAERMQAATGVRVGNHSPAAAQNTTARQGGDIINHGK